MAEKKIYLNKLNDICKGMKELGSRYDKLEEAFLNEFAYEDHRRTVDDLFSDKFYLDNISERFEGKIAKYVVEIYQKHVCPEIDLWDRFGFDMALTDGFDAIKIINFLNEQVFDRREDIAFEDIMKKVLRLFGLNYGQRHEKGLRFICHSTIRKFGKIDQTTRESLYAFDQLTNLVLDNKKIFSRVAPSQVRGIYIDLDVIVPTSHSFKGEYIDWMDFFARGRIDIHFRKRRDLEEVAEVILGREPEIYYPEADKPDVNELFDKDRRQRRVCKR